MAAGTAQIARGRADDSLTTFPAANNFSATLTSNHFATGEAIQSATGAKGWVRAYGDGAADFDGAIGVLRLPFAD